MHELAATQSLVDLVLGEARKNRVTSIRTVHIRIGAVNDYSDETLQWLFGELTRETLADGAKLQIRRTPIRLKCGDCGNIFETSIERPLAPCPACDSENTSMIEGREFLLESIEVQ